MLFSIKVNYANISELVNDCIISINEKNVLLSGFKLKLHFIIIKQQIEVIHWLRISLFQVCISLKVNCFVALLLVSIALPL